MTFDFVSKNGQTMTDTERSSIENSIRTIASTPYGTAPYMRNMGIEKYPPSLSSPISRNTYATEVVSQCGIWEDRAEVSEVTFEDENRVRMVITSE